MGTLYFLTIMHVAAAGDSAAPAIFSGIFGIVIILLVLVMAVLTFLLPFYVYAINAKLAKLNETAEALLQAQNNTVRELWTMRTGGHPEEGA